MADHDYDVDFLDQLLAEADNLGIQDDPEPIIEPEPINIRDLLPKVAELFTAAQNAMADSAMAIPLSDGAVAIESVRDVEIAEVEVEAPDYFAVMVWEMLTNSCPALSKVDAIEKYHHPDINEFHFRMHCTSIIVVARKVQDEDTFWWDLISYEFIDETAHPDF